MKQVAALIIGLVLMTELASAQKRNIIKPLGVALDGGVIGLLGDEAQFISAVNLGYTGGYERLMGSRVSVGIQFTKYIPISTSLDSYYGMSDYEGPQKVPGYYFSAGTYTRTGFNLEYESRFYLGDFDEQGVRSAYLGFAYQFASFTESFRNAEYYSHSGSGSKLMNFPDQKYIANRFGLKFGYAGANAVSSNFFAGFYINAPGTQSKEWKSLSPMSPISVHIGWTFGIPFQ